MELEKFQSIITKYNVDEYNNPIAVTKTEEQQIHPLKNLIQTGVADELQGFTILNKTMYEVRNYDDIQNANQYWVDYANGRIYFHSSLKGAAIRYRYGELGQELISATRIFTKLDERGNVVELLSDFISNMETAVAESINNFENKITESTNSLINKINQSTTNLENKITESTNNLEGEINNLGNEVDGFIEKIKEYVAILGTFEEATAVIKNLEGLIDQGELTKERLNSAIANAQDDINTIEAAGNTEILVQASEWVLNGDVYEKEITHDLYSDNIHLSARTISTKEALTIGYKIIDKTRILLKSDEAIGMSIIINSSYYHPLITTNVDEGEIVRARENQASLDANMMRKINYEDFNGNTIN